MSRSYRRPYAAITGLASAKSDKQLAHRGVRRKQNLALKTCIDFRKFSSSPSSRMPLEQHLLLGTRRRTKLPSANRHDSDDDYSRKYYRKLLRK